MSNITSSTYLSSPSQNSFLMLHSSPIKKYGSCEEKKSLPHVELTLFSTSSTSNSSLEVDEVTPLSTLPMLHAPSVQYKPDFEFNQDFKNNLLSIIDKYEKKRVTFFSLPHATRFKKRLINSLRALVNMHVNNNGEIIKINEFLEGLIRQFIKNVKFENSISFQSRASRVIHLIINIIIKSSIKSKNENLLSLLTSVIYKYKGKRLKIRKEIYVIFDIEPMLRRNYKDESLKIINDYSIHIDENLSNFVEFFIQMPRPNFNLNCNFCTDFMSIVNAVNERSKHDLSESYQVFSKNINKISEEIYKMNT